MRIILLLISLQIFAVTKIDLPYSASLSPDGKQVVFSWNDDIWLASSEGGHATRLTQTKGLDYRPMFSPDGKSIAFESNRLGPQFIFTMPADGGQAKQVSFNSEGYTLLQWFNESENIAFSSGRRLFTPRQGQLPYILNAKNTEAEHILFNSRMREFDLSPDEKRVLFTREGSQRYRKGYRGSQASQIWLYDRTSKEYTLIKHDAWNNRTPKWRADGKSFYFLSDESGSNDIYLYELEKNSYIKTYDSKGEHVLNLSISHDRSTLIWRRLFSVRWTSARSDSYEQGDLF